jgi:hypothetical protein
MINAALVLLRFWTCDKCTWSSLQNGITAGREAERAMEDIFSRPNEVNPVPFSTVEIGDIRQRRLRRHRGLGRQLPWVVSIRSHQWIQNRCDTLEVISRKYFLRFSDNLVYTLEPSGNFFSGNVFSERVIQSLIIIRYFTASSSSDGAQRARSWYYLIVACEST